MDSDNDKLELELKHLDRREISLLTDSSLFDFDFYSRANPDIVESGMDPLYHYLLYGAGELRDPHPLFDTSYYIENNTDVDFSAINPLSHYVLFGAAEGKDPHPLFSTSYFKLQHKGLESKDPIPLRQYLLSNDTDINPHPLFDTRHYCAQIDGIGPPDLNPLVHFLLYGTAAGLDPHPQFETSFYLRQNPDVLATGINPLVHYFLYGKSENRLSCNEFVLHTKDALSELYPSLYEIDPLLPSPDSLGMLPLRKSLIESRSGETYFKIAEALNEPFEHVVLIGDTSEELSKLPGLLDSILRDYRSDSVIVLAPDSGIDTARQEHYLDEKKTVRFFGTEWFPTDLILAERIAIVVRILLQAAPKFVYNCHSNIGKVIYREYSKQICTNSSWFECPDYVLASHEKITKENKTCAELHVVKDQIVKSTVDISFVMNCHCEGELLSRTIPAASLLVETARQAELCVEWIFVLDNSDETTISFIEKYAPTDAIKLRTDFGDPGLARNAATLEARGLYISFMDADDILSSNWLVAAHKFIDTLTDDTVVLHPFASIYFGETEMVNIYPDSDDSNFSPTALMEDSIWITNGFAKRSIYHSYPYNDANYREGFDFEDWHWNCETIAGGVAHKTVPNTFFCYRVKPALNSKNARAHSCLLKKNSLFEIAFLKR